MKALVINLERATDRMQFQSQQLKCLGIDFTRLPAVSIDDVADELYAQYESTWERPLRHSEVACFLSHQQAWEMVMQEQLPMLILEDDALLSQCAPDLLQALEKLSHMDLMSLEVRSRKKIVAKNKHTTVCDSAWLRLYQDRTGAAGYILWPSGAKKLLHRVAKGKIALADAFISSTYTLNAYQIEPAAIIQLDQCALYGVDSPLQTESAISTEKKPRTKDKAGWVFRVKRIVGQLRLGIRQLSVLHKSERREVVLRKDAFKEILNKS